MLHQRPLKCRRSTTRLSQHHLKAVSQRLFPQGRSRPLWKLAHHAMEKQPQRRRTEECSPSLQEDIPPIVSSHRQQDKELQKYRRNRAYPTSWVIVGTLKHLIPSLRQCPWALVLKWIGPLSNMWRSRHEARGWTQTGSPGVKTALPPPPLTASLTAALLMARARLPRSPMWPPSWEKVKMWRRGLWPGALSTRLRQRRSTRGWRASYWAVLWKFETAASSLTHSARGWRRVPTASLRTSRQESVSSA